MRKKYYVIIPFLSCFFSLSFKWPSLQGIMSQESIATCFTWNSWLKAEAESNEDHEVLEKYTVSQSIIVAIVDVA